MTILGNERDNLLSWMRRRSPVKAALRQADHLLDWRQWFANRDRPLGDQLFILGLPRSGTTLVYQYIIHRLEAAYFLNSMRYSFFWPCLDTSLRLRGGRVYQSDFKSRYGTTRGPMAPHEGGEFWNRFFDKEAYQKFRDIHPDSINHITKTVRCLQETFGSDLFVNKNVKHLLRIDALAGIFPDCRFLVVERDLADVALSLMRSRMKLFGRYDRWFSVRPENYNELLRLEPPEQVAGQVRHLARTQERDLGSLDPSRVSRILYRDFCKDPEDVFNRFPSLFGSVPKRNEPVPRFQIVHSSPENSMEARTLDALERLTEHGRREADRSKGS
jgi:hypothetical protein